MNYSPQYKTWLEKAQVSSNDLPEKLMALIKAFENSLSEWRKADPSEKAEYQPVLEKTDAFISASVYSLYREKIEPASFSKAKLLALKAKALQIDMND